MDRRLLLFWPLVVASSVPGCGWVGGPSSNSAEVEVCVPSGEWTDAGTRTIWVSEGVSINSSPVRETEEVTVSGSQVFYGLFGLSRGTEKYFFAIEGSGSASDAFLIYELRIPSSRTFAKWSSWQAPDSVLSDKDAEFYLLHGSRPESADVPENAPLLRYRVTETDAAFRNRNERYRGFRKPIPPCEIS